MLKNKYIKYIDIVIILFIFIPIFINLDFSNGLHFDANYLNKYKHSSIPISVLIVLILMLCYYKELIKSLYTKNFLIFSVFMFMYLILNYIYGTKRAFIVAGGMFLLLISYILFSIYFKNRKNIYKYTYMIISSIIILKLFGDIYLHDYILKHPFNIISGISVDSIPYIILKTQNMSTFSTSYFLNINMAIYNYFTYFALLYYLAIIMSLYNIFNKKYFFLSFIILIISLVLIKDTWSRLYIYSVYLIPILLLIYYKLLKLDLNKYFYIFIFIVIITTFFIGLTDVVIADKSLYSRIVKIRSYFQDFKLYNFILPFVNEYRKESFFSFHNEFLEIYSFFGFIIFYYLYFLKNMFYNTKKEYEIIVYLLLFVVIIGELIQMQSIHPWNAIIIAFLLAIFRKEDKYVEL